MRILRRRVPFCSLLPSCVVVLALSAIGQAASAQTVSNKAAAEGLFDQGKAAMQAGDFTTACNLLERSQHVDPAAGTLLYLAECYEKSSRTASAWATFREAADVASAAHEPDRVRIGRQRAERLEPLLSRLTLQVAPESQQLTGLLIERQGQPVPAATWNVPLPVDPGSYVIAVSAPGYEPWSRTVSIPDHAAHVSVAIPVLRERPEAKSAAPPASVGPPTGPGVASQQASAQSVMAQRDQHGDQRPGEHGGGMRRTGAYVLGGVGVVGLGVGSVFGVRAIMKNNEAKDHCPRGYQCDDTQGAAASDDAKRAARVSNIAFAVGALSLAGGVVWYFIKAPEEGGHASRATSLSARISPNGITLGGSFQ